MARHHVQLNLNALDVFKDLQPGSQMIEEILTFRLPSVVGCNR